MMIEIGMVYATPKLYINHIFIRRMKHSIEPSPHLHWHRVYKHPCNKIFHQLPHMCVLILILVSEIYHTGKINNTCEKRHGHLCRFETLLIHILPCIHYFVIELLASLLLSNTILLHVALNS